jgi:ribosomal protein S18 acetylase RimI-like enzyme
MPTPVSAKKCRIRFRLLRPQDAPCLQELRHRAIQECAHQFGTPPEIELARGQAYYRRQLLEGHQKGAQAILGGWIEESLSVMAGIRRKKTSTGPVGLITSMYVVPAYRGCGAGQVLLRQAMERVEALWHLRRCQMNVEVNNQVALDLYLKNGFRILSREENAFRIDGISHAVYLLERG